MNTQIPASMNAECPDCDEETLHKTLKGRFAGKKRLEMVLKCSKCGKVRTEVLEAVGQIKLKMVISRDDVSERTTTELPADWVLHIGDEFKHENERLQVSGIDVNNVKVKSASTREIQILWTKNYDRAKVKVSINHHGRTRSLDILADPEDEFSVESTIEVDGAPVSIHSIKLKDKTIRRGSATARDIVRIYCTDSRPSRRPPRRESFNKS
jgi:uncharacterized Zn finger protein